MINLTCTHNIHQRALGCALCKMDDIEQLEERIKDLEAAQRWIPVSERLPEKSQQVLGALKSSTGNYNLSRINRVTACDHDWEADGFEISNCWTVTHWMPLPEPPQEQEE